MKLYGSFTSPFVRTVRMAAIELGLFDDIEFVETVVVPATKCHRIAAGEDMTGRLLMYPGMTRRRMLHGCLKRLAKRIGC